MKSSVSIQYDTVSRLFHWLTALAVLVAFVPGPEGFGRLMRDGDLDEAGIPRRALRSLGHALVWPAGVHAVAALYHYYVVKHGVLFSVMPGKAR